MKTITVKTGKPYNIKIASGLLNRFPEILSETLGSQKPTLAIVTDDTVDALYGQTLHKQLADAGYSVCKFVFAHGEESKTLETVTRVYDFFSANSITRSDLVIALGGGVVGDLAGFAAASWLRGIEFIQVPTTFLAMIDSSVGGKTGVDIPQGKNLVGAFWQPKLVVCDPNALDTLPKETFADGVAEAIKYGAILDDALFELLEQKEIADHLEDVIACCVNLKREVVEQDERDKGIRQWLNFGHTLGHAVEAHSNFTLAHGRGVAIGMVMVCEACEKAGITPNGTAKRIANCCQRYGLPTSTDAPLAVLCKTCMQDKKRVGSSISLVVLEKIGRAALYPVQADKLHAFLAGERYE